MNRKWKSKLQSAFEAPTPQKKEDFLKEIKRRQVEAERVTYWQFLRTQASYIPKWVWGIALLVFGVALVGGHFLERDVLWLLSAMMPFLAMSAALENARSEMYAMMELEMASRFSLKSVVLARMGILGVVHLGVLCCITLLGQSAGWNTLFRTGVYLLVPYLLTDAGGLWLTRKIHGKEAGYACVGLAVIIGVVPVVVRYLSDVMYTAGAFRWWILALVVLGGVVISEMRKSIDRTEELVWNS